MICDTLSVIDGSKCSYADIFFWYRRVDESEWGKILILSSKMDPEGNLPDVVPKSLLNQTDISTGIGPTGTDTPAPKDIMPHADHLVCLLVQTKNLYHLHKMLVQRHIFRIYVWNWSTRQIHGCIFRCNLHTVLLPVLVLVLGFSRSCF